MNFVCQHFTNARLEGQGEIRLDTLSFKLYQIEAKKLNIAAGSLVLLPKICYSLVI